MRRLLPLLLLSCTGSPDSVTVYGGRNVASYNTAGGQPAFDEQGYGYGLALTWQLPTTHTRLQDQQQIEMLDLIRLTERNTHDVAMAHPASSVTVETGVPAEKPENSITAQTKTILGLVAAALAAAMIPVVKKLGKHRAQKKAHTP